MVVVANCRTYHLIIILKEFSAQRLLHCQFAMDPGDESDREPPRERATRRSGRLIERKQRRARTVPPMTPDTLNRYNADYRRAHGLPRRGRARRPPRAPNRRRSNSQVIAGSRRQIPVARQKP